MSTNNVSLPRWFGRLCLAAAAVACAASGRAQMVDVVNNLGDTSGGGTLVGSDSWWAQEFSTPNVSYSLNSVAVKLQNDSPPQGTFTVALWSEAPGGLPGAPIATIATGNVSDLSPNLIDYTFSAPAGLTLAANTGYFVVVSASASQLNSNLYWGYTQAAQPTWQGPGQVGSWTESQNQGNSWDLLLSDQPLQFEILATPVPEPELCALISGAALLIFAFRHSAAKCRADRIPSHPAS